MRLVHLFALFFAVTLARADSSDFTPVAKIFAEHCLDCHAIDDPEGKLVLETYDLLMKGGESGPAIVPGKSDESLLVKMIEGKFEKDGKIRFMPPGKRDKLKPEEIATVRKWIDAGAKAPEPGTVIAKEIVVPKIEPKVAPRQSIHSLAYNEKNQLLAAGRIGKVEIFSGESQSLVRTLEGPAGNVNAVAFSPDGKHFFAAGGPAGIEGEIRHWAVADGKLLRTFKGHNDSIYALAVSPDGKLLATGSYDQKVKIWNIESGAEVRTLTGHNGCVYAVAFRSDGKLLASASADRTVKLWNVDSGARTDTLSQPLKEQYTVAFSPDGKRLAAAGVDNRIRVWEISADAKETTNPLLHAKFAHDSPILKIAFSADGKLLVSSAEDRTVKLWEAAPMKEIRVLEPQPDWAPALAFILADKGLAVGRLDGSLAFYNPHSGSVLPPPKPELARIEPRGIQRGVATNLKLTGKHLERATAINFSDERISATILSEPPPKSGELWIEVKADAKLARGVFDVKVAAPQGESGAQKLYIDDLPTVVESDSELPQPIERLPVVVWGSLERSGDDDLYEFTVDAGGTVVFEAAAKSIGSKADLVLSLTDESGRVLASNNQFDKTGDPLIAHTFESPGRYRLLVSELLLAGSSDHFYRISMGTFPFVTAAYPPIVQRGQDSQIHLVGYNLNQEQQSVNAAEGSEFALKLDPGKLRWRGNPKVQVTDQQLVLESEPNDAVSTATSLGAPAIAAGQIAQDDAEDWFRFEAKSGQTWILEVAADRLGSLLDSKLEIRDAEGKPVPRVLLQAVRDSAVTFRGIDSTTPDCRVENWEEMELNQYLYLQGEVVRLFRAPQGPDSGFLFYTLGGKRRNYFDTTATSHADAEPCYIVEPHPVGAKLVPNGLPVFELFFENDDDAERKLGPDSKLYFTAPVDGVYFARVTDTRGFSGDLYHYTLTVRQAQPDFHINVDGTNPRVPRGGGMRITVNADRTDGFEGEIKIEISGLPPGISASSPITVQEGHTTAFGTIYAAEDAFEPSAEAAKKSKLVATAQINGKTVSRESGSLGKISLSDTAPLYVELEPVGSATPEITIAPGGTVPALIKIRRNGHNDLVTFQIENLPHGIIVDNIGLNGVLIPKDQNQREIFITAAKWVPETDRLCYAVSNEAGRQTSRPILIKVRRSANQVARN